MSETEALDSEPLGEDVFMHTMARWHQHDDQRSCGYHSRLGAWVVFSRQPMDRRCLRDHDTTPATERTAP